MLKVSLLGKTEIWVKFSVISSHLYFLRPRYVHCKLGLSQFTYLPCKLSHLSTSHVLISFPTLYIHNCWVFPVGVPTSPRDSLASLPSTFLCAVHLGPAMPSLSHIVTRASGSTLVVAMMRQSHGFSGGSAQAVGFSSSTAFANEPKPHWFVVSQIGSTGPGLALLSCEPSVQDTVPFVSGVLMWRVAEFPGVNGKGLNFILWT